MVTEIQNPLTTAAKNIRKELKAAFPNTKFQVRSSRFAGGNSIDISWDRGPTDKAVTAITKKYQAGDFDGMTDCYNYHTTPLHTERGQAKYVHTSRGYGPDEDNLLKLIDIDLCTLHGVRYTGDNTNLKPNEGFFDVYHHVSSFRNRVLHATDFLRNTEYHGVKWSEKSGCCATPENMVEIF